LYGALFGHESPDAVLLVADALTGRLAFARLPLELSRPLHLEQLPNFFTHGAYLIMHAFVLEVHS